MTWYYQVHLILVILFWITSESQQKEVHSAAKEVELIFLNLLKKSKKCKQAKKQWHHV